MIVESFIGVTTDEIDDAIRELVKNGCGIDEAIEDVFSCFMYEFEADLNDYLENL